MILASYDNNVFTGEGDNDREAILDLLIKLRNDVEHMSVADLVNEYGKLIEDKEIEALSAEDEIKSQVLLNEIEILRIRANVLIRSQHVVDNLESYRGKSEQVFVTDEMAVFFAKEYARQLGAEVMFL